MELLREHFRVFSSQLALYLTRPDEPVDDFTLASADVDDSEDFCMLILSHISATSGRFYDHTARAIYADLVDIGNIFQNERFITAAHQKLQLSAAIQETLDQGGEEFARFYEHVKNVAGITMDSAQNRDIVFAEIVAKQSIVKSEKFGSSMRLFVMMNALLCGCPPEITE